jgi:chemotaxis protein MotB
MTEPASFSNTRPSPKTFVPWIATAAAGLTAVLILFQVALPAREQRDGLTRELQQAKEDLATAKGAASAQEALLTQLLADKDDLTEQRTAVQEQLTRAIQEKETAVAELERTKKELNDAFGPQISAGDVLIQERKGELVIDVSDRLLFDSGETALNDAGQAFLREVAKTMRRLSPAQVFRVGGHTDAQRIVTKEVAERYPTNWELSAARATNVVRYLQEGGKVPGSQLIAAGFSQYRPASTNQTEAGRQKNRRIEIVLQRDRKGASTLGR